MERVGLIGLGQMGSAMARAFADGGREVYAFDVRPDVVAEAAAEGLVTAAASAREVGEAADTVVVAVYSPHDAHAAMLADDGVLAGQTSGKVTVDTTTNSVDVTRQLVAAYTEQGVDFLTSPVTGRPPHMTMMMGGERGVFDRVTDLLGDVADRTIFVGSWEAACIAKHVNQFLTYLNFVVACEGLVAAQRAGISTDELCNVLETGSGNSLMLKFAISEVTEREPPVVPAALRLVAKDIRLARESLERVGLDSELLRTANAMYDRAEQAIGEQRFPALLGHLAGSL